MKKLSILAAAILLFSACSTNNYLVADLGSFKPSSDFTSTKSVYIQSVQDARVNKQIVGTRSDKDGNIEKYVVLSSDLRAWFESALKTQLTQNKISLEDNGEAAVVDVFIKEFNANLSGFQTDNLKSNIVVELRIEKDGKVITKKLAEPQTKFVALKTTSVFENIYRDMVNSMVKRVALEIISE
nr:hypothetical protein [Campylobacter sp.]